MEAPPDDTIWEAAAPPLGESFAGRPNCKGGDDLRTSWKRTERTDDLTRSLEKKKRTCNVEPAIKPLISGDLHLDSNQGVSSELELCEAVASNMSKSVVSIALSNGHTVLFACSGIGMEREGHVTRFLTSASLVRVFNDRKKYHDSLKVEVRHEGSVVIGYLGGYDLDCGIASVHVKAFPGREALVDEKWVEDIQGDISVDALMEYFELWSVLEGMELKEGIPDKHI